MIMNMLTGAHTSLIPLITGLHDEAGAENDTWNIPAILGKLDAILRYPAEGWVQNMAVDMILDFFRKLPDDILQEVASNIQLHDDIPLRLCLYLMDQNAKIAENFIQNTDVLEELDLIYRIHSGEIHEMIAMARRKNLSIDVLNALIESKQPQVYIEMLHNPCVIVQEDVIRHLQDVASRSAKVAWHLVAMSSGRPSQKIRA